MREKVGFIEKTAWRHRRTGGREVTVTSRLHRQKDKERQRKTAEKGDVDDDVDDVGSDDVYYYIRWRLKLKGETENMGVCTKERKGVTAAVLMATPCTNSLGGESGGQKHEGCDLPQKQTDIKKRKKEKSWCSACDTAGSEPPHGSAHHADERCISKMRL